MKHHDWQPAETRHCGPASLSAIAWCRQGIFWQYFWTMEESLFLSMLRTCPICSYANLHHRPNSYKKTPKHYSISQFSFIFKHQFITKGISWTLTSNTDALKCIICVIISTYIWKVWLEWVHHDGWRLKWDFQTDDVYNLCVIWFFIQRVSLITLTQMGISIKYWYQPKMSIPYSFCFFRAI